MRLINKLTFITIIITTLFAQFDGMSIGYDGSRFQSATFHNNKLIYGLDFLHARVSTEFENEIATAGFWFWCSFAGFYINL